MRFTRISKALGVAAVSALALSACASTDSGSSGGGDGETKSVSVAETNPFTSLNPSASEGNSDINNKIQGLTHNGFYHVDDKLNVVHNTDFGTYEKISDNPMKVKYTVNEDAEWSDGNKVDASDLLLAWAATSGHYDAKDENGDPAEGGPTFFKYAGDADGLGMTDLPEISDDGRTMTLTYSQPFIDWETAYDVGLPGHVVAEKAGMSEDELVDLFKTAKPGEQNEKLAKVAKVWNDDFQTTTLPSDESLYLASGAYKIKDVVENQSVTLERNDKYTGEKPKVDEITIRTLSDNNAQIQALNNGEVDIITPQASVDTIQQIKDADGVNLLEGDELSYDHLDLNFASDVFKDEDTRKAFLLTIPRQDIVNKLIKPMKDDASVLNSQIFVASQKPYADAVKENDSSEYPSDDMDANIAKAKELLGGKTPTVKILYNSENPNRVDTFSMIQESAKKAGFNIVDGGDANWSKMLPSGDYDASIFGWVSPGIGHAMYGQLFGAGGGGNYGKYNNADVNKTIDEIRTTVDDEDKVNELGTSIDKHLFQDGFGLPLFQSVGVVGVKDRVKNVTFNPGSASVYWNVEEWDVQ